MTQSSEQLGAYTSFKQYFERYYPNSSYVDHIKEIYPDIKNHPYTPKIAVEPPLQDQSQKNHQPLQPN